MNKQEIFNKIYQGLKSQDWEQSVNEFGTTCMYRGIKNRKCAVGHLIPDELYDEKIETQAVQNSNVQQILNKIGLFSDKITMLTELQSIHDTKFGTENKMKGAFERYAQLNNLDIPNAD